MRSESAAVRVLQIRRRGGYRRRMAPKELRVGFPTTLATLLNPTAGLAPARLIEAVDGQWLRLSGAGLPREITVRVEEQDDGRFVVTGLLIASAEHEELTWSDLRAIRPASLVAEVFRDFDPDVPYPPDMAVDESSARHVAALLWSASRPAGAPRAATAPTKSARARVADDLEAFAVAYRRNRALAPHRAMTATADQLGISRATAIRRAQECRERGLLPAREK